MHPDTLRQLAANCRKPEMRFLQLPCDWRPREVRRPGDEFDPYFSDASAWEFIADKIDEGHIFEEKILDNPKGALAIVMLIKVTEGSPLLYVKVQVGARNKAIGRSFHYSEYN